jgi:hypothetical protein
VRWSTRPRRTHEVQVLDEHVFCGMTEQVLVLGFGQISYTYHRKGVLKVSIVSFPSLFVCSIYIFELRN